MFIVVIAIMAVLVGVLAPTLIKNIEKSRESKDAQNIEQIKSACEVALQNENAYQNTVKDTNVTLVTLVTLTSSNCTVASANGDFKTEFDGIMKVEGTKLTSKKYKGKTVTFIVNKDGQVSYSETTTPVTP